MTDLTQMSYRRVLRIPGLAALLLATTLARLASRMFSLALVLYVLARFASPDLAGWLSFSAVLPGLLISPLAGALLDRIGPVRAITTDLAVSAVAIVALVGADALGGASPELILVLVVLYSLTSPLSRAGVRTLLPQSVPVAALDRVNAVDTSIYALVDVIGPAVAGLLVAAAGPAPALAAIAACYAVAAICVARVRAHPRAARPSASLSAQTLEGVSGLVVGLLLAGVVAGPVDVGLLTLRQRRTEPAQLGRVLAISMSLNVAGFPLGSAIAGMLITGSLSLTFFAAGLASALGALATLAIPRDREQAF